MSDKPSSPLKAPTVTTSTGEPTEAASLKEFIASLKMGRKWHMLAFTDGSGGRIDEPGGFAGVMLPANRNKPEIVVGTSLQCSSQQAEVRAVMEVCHYLSSRKAGDRPGGYHLHLVTDSAYVAGQIERIAKDPMAIFESKAHNMLWVAVQFATRQGIVLTPHHLPRNSNPLMTLADTLSKEARTSVNSEEIEPLLSKCLLECQQNWPLIRKIRKLGAVDDAIYQRH